MKKATYVPVPPDIMGLAPNTGHLAVRGAVHLTVRGEPVEPPATEPLTRLLVPRVAEGSGRTGAC